MFRLLIPVSMAILAVVLIEKGVGECNQCEKGTEDGGCNNTFATNLTEDDSFCKNIKADSTRVTELCATFPKGYKLKCSNITCEGTCSAAVATGINNLTPIVLMAIVLFYIAG